MGNHQNKLGKNFTSLPADAFPSQKYGARGFDHKPSLRQSKRTAFRSSVNLLDDQKQNHAAGPQQKDSLSPVPFIDTLFEPEYPICGDISESDFEVVQVIAKGAFGNVIKVRRKKDHAVYAMKVMEKSKVIIKGAVQQIKEEATIQDAVGYHPFIVKVHWFFQNHDNLFLVMTFIERGDLFDIWKRVDSFAEGQVRIYVAELAMVLDFLHGSGIIFRDLKMENVMLDQQGHVQLVDFGLAKWLKRGQRTRTICGTLNYIAPEILSMEPYGHTSDWWSLGILMYALLAGEFPISGATDHLAMADLVSDHNYTLPATAKCSWQARLCLAQLLDHNPTERLQSLVDVQRHPFFEGFLNFDQLFKRKIQPAQLWQSKTHNGNSNYGNDVLDLGRYNIDGHSRGNGVIHMGNNQTVANGESMFSVGNLTFSWSDSVASLDEMYI